MEIPDPNLPYLLVNGLVVVADNIETDYGADLQRDRALWTVAFDEVLEIGESRSVGR